MKSELRKLTQEQYNKTYCYLVKEAGSKDLEDIFNFITHKPVKITTRVFYLNSVISLQKSDPDLFTNESAIDKIIEERNKLGEGFRESYY
ncbi:MAG: hypothetical protein ACTSQA_09350 [Candidatus Heimdallarchaeaceae archaeon]